MFTQEFFFLQCRNHNGTITSLYFIRSKAHSTFVYIGSLIYCNFTEFPPPRMQMLLVSKMCSMTIEEDEHQ